MEAVILSSAALTISLLLFGLFVWASGVSPIETYYLLLRGAFGTSYSWRNTLIHASPLLLTSLCIAVPARVGLIVIGGEGCVILGGLMAALAAHLMPASPPLIVQTAMIVAGMTTGGLWIGLVGVLRQYRGVNETISSLLLNYIALAILNHCVEGPMHDPTSLNHPSSWLIGDANMLGNIPGTEVHWGFAYGIIACVFCWFLLDFTSQGFAASVVGGNVRAARVAGLSIAKFTLVACFIGGAFAALTGVVEVMAIHGRAQRQPGGRLRIHRNSGRVRRAAKSAGRDSRRDSARRCRRQRRSYFRPSWASAAQRRSVRRNSVPGHPWLGYLVRPLQRPALHLVRQAVIPSRGQLRRKIW